MIFYFAKFPASWSLKPRFFKTPSEIKNTVRDYTSNLKIDPVELDKFREKEVDRFFEEMQHRADKKGAEYIPRNDIYFKYHQEIEESTKKMFFEKLYYDNYHRIKHMIQKVDIDNSDRNDLARLEELANKYGVPDLAFPKALDARRAVLDWASTAIQYYKTAYVTNSVFRGLPGTKKLIQEFPKLVRLRYYKNEDGSTRQTVEIEIGA